MAHYETLQLVDSAGKPSVINLCKYEQVILVKRGSKTSDALREWLLKPRRRASVTARMGPSAH